jgi:hypothetical protein
MRRGQPPPEPRRARVATRARRVWPVALEVWRRWDRLPDHQKERYRQMASDYARRGRDAWARSQKQRRR